MWSQTFNSGIPGLILVDCLLGRFLFLLLFDWGLFENKFIFLGMLFKRWLYFELVSLPWRWSWTADLAIYRLFISSFNWSLLTSFQIFSFFILILFKLCWYLPFIVLNKGIDLLSMRYTRLARWLTNFFPWTKLNSTLWNMTFFLLQFWIVNAHFLWSALGQGLFSMRGV